MKSFRTYMAETGQQSTLDNLERNFKFGEAESQYNSQGWYGSGGTENSGGQGYGSGASAPSAPNLPPVDVAGNLAQYDTLLSATPSTLGFIQANEKPVDYALSQLIAAMGARANPLDVYTQFENEMGLPGQRKVAGTLREQIYSLEDAIRGVEPMIEGTTRNSMVTQGQRTMMETAAKEPLLENLGRFTTDLGRIGESIASMEKALGTRVDLYMAGQEQQLEPLKLQLTSFQERAARLLSGFSADKQTALELMLAKIKRGEELGDQARAETFALLQSEQEYRREIDMLKRQSDQNIADYRAQSQIDLSKYTSQAGIDLGTYKSKAEIDKLYKPVGGTTASDGW
jgi:hypothetical protein